MSETIGIRLKSPVGLVANAWRALAVMSPIGWSAATQAAITAPMPVPPTTSISMPRSCSTR